MKLRPLVRGTLHVVRFVGILLLGTAGSGIAPAQTSNTAKAAAAALPAELQYPGNENLLPGKGPVQKWDQFPRLWAERRTEFWQHRKQDEGAVVFLGDSITQGWSDLARAFPDLKTANRGIGGDTTRGVLFRMKEDVLEEHPAAVVLLVGVNDLGQGGKPEDAADNIRLILAALKKSNPRMPVIVCKVMPSNESMAPKIKALNGLVDDLVNSEPQWIRCDTWSIYANEDGTCKKEEFPDQLHPNKLGYEKWKAALKPILAGLQLEQKKAD
jgi:lysophospholipase L1-like esterase